MVITKPGVRMKKYATGGNHRAVRSRGFTLIELMIGILVVAVLFGIGAPMFQLFIADQRLRATTSDLRIALNTARSEAVKRNRIVQLLPHADGWNSGWRIPSPNVGEPDILVRTIAGEQTLSVSGAVTFMPVGRVLNVVEFEIDVSPGAHSLGCLQLALDGSVGSKKGACSDA